jgi:RNA-directed DNA polymerase
MSAVEERISDRRLLSLLRAFLRAGVMEQGTVRRPVTGTAQGGVISPLMCNVYLHRLDRAWRGAYGTYLRYADDALVMCRSKGQAVAALARLTVLLAELGLRPKPAKTRIVQLTAGAREWTSLASIIGWCDPGPSPAAQGSPSWPAGPHARRCSMPETASGS